MDTRLYLLNMKMKNHVIGFILPIIFLVAACGKEEHEYEPIPRCPDLTSNIDTIKKYIPGTWKWAEEVRYDRIAGIRYFTPNSPGWHHVSVKLYGDTAQFFVNNKIDSARQFKIQRLLEITNFNSDSTPVLVYYNFHNGVRRSSVPIWICKDQLIMQYQLFSDIAGDQLWIRK